MSMLIGYGLQYLVLGLASCTAIIYMSSFDLMLFHFMEPEIEMSFVGRNGTQFVLDGRSFYVSGWNSYWLMDQAVEEHSLTRVTAMFDTGAKIGLSVCRTWAFNDCTYHALQVAPGRFDGRVFKGLDRVILEARRHGIRLILSLANNLRAYGGKTQYVRREGIGMRRKDPDFAFPGGACKPLDPLPLLSKGTALMGLANAGEGDAFLALRVLEVLRAKYLEDVSCSGELLDGRVEVDQRSTVALREGIAATVSSLPGPSGAQDVAPAVRQPAQCCSIATDTYCKEGTSNVVLQCGLEKGPGPVAGALDYPALPVLRVVKRLKEIVILS